MEPDREIQVETASLVHAAPAPAPPRAGPRKPKALLVAHGMGQQIRFETLDAIANGLYREDREKHGTDPTHKAKAARVQFGDQPLERFEMQLREAGGGTQEVHVYEAYWSPLTEGAVTLRDVVRFLFRAGANGLQNAGGKFRHWAFKGIRQRSVPVQTLVFLLLSLWVVASLVTINGIIVAVPVFRSPMTTVPAWLSDALFRDLTHVFNAAVIVLVVFGLLLWLSGLASRAGAPMFLRRVLSFLSVLAFPCALFAIVATAIAAPMLISAHASAGRGDASFVPRIVVTLGSPTRIVVLGGAGLFILWHLLKYLSAVLRGWLGQLAEAKASGRMVTSTLAILVLVTMAYGAYVLAGDIRSRGTPSEDTLTILKDAPVWVALALIGIVVRQFFVQYVGDVAAYVESHTIDKFQKLRTDVRDVVLKTARAIYAQKIAGTSEFAYDEIVVAGHSLGSVVAYDVLNRLLLDDSAMAALGAAGKDKVHGVEGRTKLFLTFGSPLDKTAFVFANQSKGKELTPAREALAGLVQPLIDEESVRKSIEWVNVFSPWDIISGSLDYYDNPEWTAPRGKKPWVINERDPQAVTLLAAHVEYWRNRRVFGHLYRALNPRGPATMAQPASSTLKPATA